VLNLILSINLEKEELYILHNGIRYKPATMTERHFSHIKDIDGKVIDNIPGAVIRKIHTFNIGNSVISISHKSL